MSIKAFVALARFLVLLLLKFFWYKHNAESNLSPSDDVIVKKCWHIFLRFLTQDPGFNMCIYFLKIHLKILFEILTSFWNLWPLAIVSSLDSRRQGHTVKELIFLHFSNKQKGVIYLNVQYIRFTIELQSKWAKDIAWHFTGFCLPCILFLIKA